MKPVQKKTRKQCNNRREQKKKKNQQLRSFSRCSFSRGCENFLFEIFFSFASRSRNLFLPLNFTNLFFGTFRGFFSCARKKNHVYDFSYGFFTYDFFFLRKRHTRRMAFIRKYEKIVICMIFLIWGFRYDFFFCARGTHVEWLGFYKKIWENIRSTRNFQTRLL